MEGAPQVPETIHKLVEKYEFHLAAYKKGKYNETQLRREFIDPFFKTLGWDVDNTALNKQRADVKTDHEKNLIERQIEATDKQIDALVYELYGLTEEEIKIVEGEGK